MMRFHHLFVSPGHNYSGHPGGPPGDRSVIEADPIKCVASCSMRNDLLVGNFDASLTFGKLGLLAEYLASRNENGAGANLDANDYGFWVQRSCKFDKHREGVVRYNYADPDGDGINLSDGVRSASSSGTTAKLTDYYIGFTNYISGNDLKVQTDYVYGESKATASGIHSHMQIHL